MDFSTNFTVRTDLAYETAEKLIRQKGKIDDGITFEHKKVSGLNVDVVRVKSGEGERQSGKNAGTYVTVNTGEMWNEDKSAFENSARVIANIVKKMLVNDGLCLVVCLGNENIIADAVGPFCAKNLVVTRHIKKNDVRLFEEMKLRECACITPGVMGSTGAEALELVRGAVKELSPSSVVVIDALACSNLSRLARTVQITDSGICPGSGVGNNRQEISERTLGVPTIAIGVPTVVETSCLCLDILSQVLKDSKETYNYIEGKMKKECNSSFVCPKETDKIINCMSKLIGYSLNFALHEDMTMPEMDEFLM